MSKVDGIKRELLKREGFIWVLLLIAVVTYGVTHRALRFYVIGAVFFVFVLIYRLMGAKVKIDIPIVLYMLGMGIYCVVKKELLLQLLVEPVLFYVLSRELVQLYSDKTKRVIQFVLALVGGLFVRGLCDWGVLILGREEHVTIWTGFLESFANPRTVHEFYLLPVTALFFYVVYLFGVKKERLALAIGISLAIILANILAFISVGRMTPCVLFVSFMMLLLMAIVWNRKLLPVRVYKGVAVIIGLGILGLGVAIMTNAFGIAEKLSFWTRDGGIFGNCRFEMDAQQIGLFIKYPFGGCEEGLYDSGKDMYYYYAHNFWLQLGREGGIAPMLLVFASNVWIFVDMLGIWIHKKIHPQWMILLSSVYLAFIMYYMFEIAPWVNFEMYAVSFLVGGLIRECFRMGKEEISVGGYVI